MLNKELLLMGETFDSTKGIFLLTVAPVKVGISTVWGFYRDKNTGSMTPLGDPIVYGTKDEYFDSELTKFYAHANYSELGFSSSHKPNLGAIYVYAHVKFSDGSIGTVRYGYNKNQIETAPYNTEEYSISKLADEVGNTLRVYLGPSPTPPPWL